MQKPFAKNNAFQKRDINFWSLKCHQNSLLIDHQKMVSIAEKIVDLLFYNFDLCDQKQEKLLLLSDEVILEKLEHWFSNNNDLYDQISLELMTLSLEECNKKYEKELQLFEEDLFSTTQYQEPDTESDLDIDEYLYDIIQIHEPDIKSDSDMEITILNLDCLTDLDEREELISRWATEVSLFIKDNPDDFPNFKNVLTLVEQTTSGIVHNYVQMTEWNQDLHGLDFFRSLIKMFNIFFVGKEFLNEKLFEIQRENISLFTQLLPLQICHLDELLSIYEIYDGEHYVLKIMMTQKPTEIGFPKIFWEKEEDDRCVNLQKTMEPCRNTTNPELIYISQTLNFKGFEKYKLLNHVDDILDLNISKGEHYPHVLRILNDFSKHGIIPQKLKTYLFKTKIVFPSLEIDQEADVPQNGFKRIIFQYF